MSCRLRPAPGFFISGKAKVFLLLVEKEVTMSLNMCMDRPGRGKRPEPFLGQDIHAFLPVGRGAGRDRRL